jgi:hypothetical protein
MTQQASYEQVDEEREYEAWVCALWIMYHSWIRMTTLDMDCTSNLEVKGSLCNSMLTELGVSQIMVRFLWSLVEDKGLFRIMFKCRTKYLKDIKITRNKPILNSEFSNNNNLLVYHQISEVHQWKHCEKTENNGDFSSTDPHKMETC